MEVDLARVLGSLALEGEELGDVFIPDIAYDRVEEKYQYCLVVKVLMKRRFHVPTFKNTIRALWGGHEGLQVLGMGTNIFHIIFVDDVQMNRVLLGEPSFLEGVRGCGYWNCRRSTYQRSDGSGQEKY
ncbi:hypothetical protein LIER_29628 [Lithospermum erythrorhizon]|uniref:Uncharacterized protein n=1 Tax=Lithospermum erythrorhizon TaxID=34254 RepID=A0AAV3RKV6_LITER